MQQNAFTLWDPLEETAMVAAGSDPLRIDVFTSDSCMFCDDALDVARTAAQRLRLFSERVKVVEIDVKKKPWLIEKLDIVALPMTMIGNTRIIGLPTVQDIEHLAHRALLNPE
ncbi:MAG: hypothetical protein DRO87_05280 [Candidatus Thorarchaeota archaeon]|nr:MAG: hypothetical protein DRP09_00350 [Candidatus Thorarchaeota archaeon]RLI58577.1 MAG: hypothetical protein DRO87_05280 [Candidatus Thorarchaeota archaeon]